MRKQDTTDNTPDTSAENVPMTVETGLAVTDSHDEPMVRGGGLPEKTPRPLMHTGGAKNLGDPVHVTEINDDGIFDDDSLGGGFASVKGKKQSENRIIWIVIIVMTIMAVAVGICSSVLTGYFMRRGLTPPVIQTENQQSVAAVVSARKPAVTEVASGAIHGSGVAMKYAEGKVYVLTNAHMLSDMIAPSVRFYGEDSYYKANVVGYDSHYDIAVLSVVHDEVYVIDDSEAELAEDAVRVFDRNLKYNEGDYTVAIGNAMGMGTAAYDGIISRSSDLLRYGDKTVPVLRTTSAINAGMSGGALFDMNGRFIGLSTYRMSTKDETGASHDPADDVEDTGFVTPVSIVYPIYKQILEFGSGGELGGLIGITLSTSNSSAIGTMTLTGSNLGLTLEYRLGKLTVIGLDTVSPPSGFEVGDVVVAISGRELYPSDGAAYDLCRTVGELLSFRLGSYTGARLAFKLDRGGAESNPVIGGYFRYA